MLLAVTSLFVGGLVLVVASPLKTAPVIDPDFLKAVLRARSSTNPFVACVRNLPSLGNSEGLRLLDDEAVREIYEEVKGLSYEDLLQVLPHFFCSNGRCRRRCAVLAGIPPMRPGGYWDDGLEPISDTAAFKPLVF